MKRHLCIDPGCNESGWLIYQPGRTPMINGFGKEPNEAVLQRVKEMMPDYDILLVEELSGFIYTPPGRQFHQTTIGKEILKTAVWSGRFIQIAEDFGPKEHVLMLRRTVSANLCKGIQNPKDKDVRAALIARFGEKGTMKNPGPLYGISADVWSALALGVSFADKNVIQDTSVTKNFQPGFL